MNLAQFDVLTFDCYGTLIDWESGILSVLRPLLARNGHRPDETEILGRYALLEAAAQQGPYRPYRAILAEVVRGFGQHYGFDVRQEEEHVLAASIGRWPVFSDTLPALQILRRRYKLAVISNIDADLFEYSNAVLQAPFTWKFTAEHLGGYKPRRDNFRQAIASMGCKPEKILHVAQSVYHDIQPAQELRLATVWIQRRGFGATLPAEAKADLELPDLYSLARAVEAL